jgi:hypothetical protein
MDFFMRRRYCTEASGVEVNEDIALRRAYFDMVDDGDQTARGAEACEVVLRAVADKKLRVVGSPFGDSFCATSTSVLHAALLRCSASIVWRLIFELGVPTVDVDVDVYGHTAMHIAATSPVDALAKCQMLDARDLGKEDKLGQSPLESYLVMCYFGAGPPGAVCRWMMEQPECPLHTSMMRAMMHRGYYCQEIRQMRQDALAVRKNWTPARAAWLVAAVAVCVQVKFLP